MEAGKTKFCGLPGKAVSRFLLKIQRGGISGAGFYIPLQHTDAAARGV